MPATGIGTWVVAIVPKVTAKVIIFLSSSAAVELICVPLINNLGVSTPEKCAFLFDVLAILVSYLFRFTGFPSTPKGIYVRK